MFSTTVNLLWTSTVTLQWAELPAASVAVYVTFSGPASSATSAENQTGDTVTLTRPELSVAVGVVKTLLGVLYSLTDTGLDGQLVNSGSSTSVDQWLFLTTFCQVHVLLSNETIDLIVACLPSHTGSDPSHMAIPAVLS